MMTSTEPQTTNQALLNELLRRGAIDIQGSELFAAAPSPLPAGVSFSKIEGMLLGLAVGDALGATSEGLVPEIRRQAHGEIRDYLQNRHTGEFRGYPTDDTQLAFWTLEQMLEDGGFDPDRVAARFCQGRIFGLGSTVREFLGNYKGGTRPWWRCGPQSAGNGALMRIAPMLVPHLREPSPELWADTALAASITHNDSASIAACVAFIAMLWELIGRTEAPEPQWWVEAYLRVAKELEHREDYRPRLPALRDYEGSLWRFVEKKVPAAFERGLTTLEACESWYSGAYLLETVPSVLYILMRHGDDPEAAIVRAVNDTRDNDTIAAIVGAAVGALHGRQALPERWVEKLTGRVTAVGDDGRAFELLEQARQRWWESAQVPSNHAHKAILIRVSDGTSRSSVLAERAIRTEARQAVDCANTDHLLADGDGTLRNLDRQRFASKGACMTEDDRQPIDPQVRIGHVHLKVADLERALAFYRDILGFELTQRLGPAAAFLSAGGYHHHIGLNIWESRGGSPPAPGTTGLYHFAILYPNRRALADALKRVNEAGIPLEGAADHGVSEALYLRDPDGNGLELYWDRPEASWPRDSTGNLQMVTEPLDLEDLLTELILDAE